MALEAHILVVDDDQSIRETLEELIGNLGWQVHLCASGEEALAATKEEVFDVVFLDYRMPGIDGMVVLQEIVAVCPETSVILMTGEGSEMVARDAFKMGAFDYIAKPFRNIGDIEILINQSLERQKLRRENSTLKRENRDLKSLVDTKYSFQNIIGNTPEMMQIFDLITRVASTRSTVLISGESGVGKELIAKALHYHSDRRDESFISVNCGALPDNLLEDELFGHLRGAFTDAISDRIGRFGLAHQGTLFLDEIGTMSQNLQVKLLRVLQEREFTPLGSTQRVSVDVRIIAATNTDLRQMLEDGTFRNDLFFRLNVINIQLPPLRERPGDIPLLASHFLGKYCSEMEMEAKSFTQAALRKLMKHSWPGNIRQLENVVERAVALSSQREVLDVEDLPEDVLNLSKSGGPEPTLDGGGTFDQMVAEYEERLVLSALDKRNWNKTRAAAVLGIKRTTLIEKMKRLGIPLKSERTNRAS